MMNRYEIIIYWSNEDNVFISEVPELPGCMAYGNSYEIAQANAKEAIHLWIDTVKEIGDPISDRKGQRLMLA
jgi:predicted RNase H-like HicB family nuclease